MNHVMPMLKNMSVFSNTLQMKTQILLALINSQTLLGVGESIYQSVNLAVKSISHTHIYVRTTAHIRKQKYSYIRWTLNLWKNFLLHILRSVKTSNVGRQAHFINNICGMKSSERILLTPQHEFISLHYHKLNKDIKHIFCPYILYRATWL